MLGITLQNIKISVVRNYITVVYNDSVDDSLTLTLLLPCNQLTTFVHYF